jgi:alginate O-acetyltransferase complex protein AlgI
MGKAAVLYTFPVVVIGWVFFRFEHWGPSIAYLEKMFVPHFNQGFQIIQLGNVHYVTLGLAILFSFITLIPLGRSMSESIFERAYSDRKYLLMFALTMILFVLSAGRILTSEFNPFIYFRF